MKTLIVPTLAALALTLAAGAAPAQSGSEPTAPPAVAAKLMLRGDADGLRVPEMRMVRRNDVLIVEADFLNGKSDDRTVYYRFRWLDDGGMQVGDGEPWKQLRVMGKESKVVRGVAPSGRAVDFRVEMNIEK